MAVKIPDTLAGLLRPLADLTPFERNARKHAPADIDRLCKGLEFYGWTNPIIAWAHDGKLYISAGHLRYQAARKLGLDAVPVLVRDDWDEATFRAYTIWDNQTVLKAEWDFALLKDELVDLDTGAFDLDLTGFGRNEVYALVHGKDGKAGLTDDDAVPETAPARSKPGDVWLCGKHRVMCGDSTKAEDVARLMGGEKAQMVFTDPPYGEDYACRGATVYRDDPDTYWQWLPATFDRLDEATVLGATFYVKHSSRQVPRVMAFLAARYDIRNLIVWISNSQAHPADNYDSFYEPIYFCSRGEPSTFNKRAELRDKPPNYWCGRDVEFIGLLVNCWYDIPHDHAGCLKSESPQDGSVKAHNCAMPVGLARRGILVSSNAGDRVIDPFLGSGTTLIACEKLDRVCYGMEIEPRYVDVAVKRWEQFTGQTAQLEQKANSGEAV